MTVTRSRQVVVEIDLELQRVEDTRSVQQINVSNSGDDAICIASTGSFPKSSWQDMRKLKNVAVAIARQTEQNIVLQHNGTVLTEITTANKGTPRVSIRWWAVAKQLLINRR